MKLALLVLVVFIQWISVDGPVVFHRDSDQLGMLYEKKLAEFSLLVDGVLLCLCEFPVDFAEVRENALGNIQIVGPHNVFKLLLGVDEILNSQLIKQNNSLGVCE